MNESETIEWQRWYLVKPLVLIFYEDWVCALALGADINQKYSQLLDFISSLACRILVIWIVVLTEVKEIRDCPANLSNWIFIIDILLDDGNFKQIESH